MGMCSTLSCFGRDGRKRLSSPPASPSSSISATRYKLDVRDPNRVLVYDYFGERERITQAELANRLDKNPSQRLTVKDIEPGSSWVELVQQDLYFEDEYEKGRLFPSWGVTVAAVKVPFKMYWSNRLLGHTHKLYIISPDIKD